MDWGTLLSGWQTSDIANKAAIVAGLAGLMTWALVLAAKDVRWVYGVTNEYAKFKDRYINRIKSQTKAQERLIELNGYVAERIDATRARSARLVLLGFVLPSAVLIAWINMHAWLFNGECPLLSADCAPRLDDALVVVGWNLLQDFPFEILGASGAGPSIHINSSNPLLAALAYFVRYDALAHLLALGYFEIRVWQFRRANLDETATLTDIANPSGPQEAFAPALPKAA